VVKFKVMMSLFGEEEEVAIKVIKIWDGNETCLVGFLPRRIGYGSRKYKLRDKYTQVLELYKESADFTNKKKNGRLVDVASYRLLDDIQDLE
jgi:hypothetical protein